MNDKIGGGLFALFFGAFALYAICCTPAARAPLYPVADVLCVVAAEAAGLDEAAASKTCGIAVEVVHDVVGQHAAAKAKVGARAAASALGSGGSK